MLEHLIHAALHSFAESDLGKKVGESLDSALNTGVEAVGKTISYAGKVAEKGYKATKAGVKEAIKSYNNSK